MRFLEEQLKNLNLKERENFYSKFQKRIKIIDFKVYTWYNNRNQRGEKICEN